jgi:hypothetical protein
VSQEILGQQLIDWSQSEQSVLAMVLVGSRAHSLHGISVADRWSDWDFQIITDRPEKFSSSDWLRASRLARPLTYVLRPGRFGHTAKVSAVFPAGELDLVIIPARNLVALKWAWACGFIHQVPSASRALRDLSQVLHPGYQFVKLNRQFENLYRKIATSSTISILDDKSICVMADGYVCDYISAKHKVLRGEYLAAQRWLHVNLTEVNFRLLYERGLRLGTLSYADGRRIEAIAGKDEWRDAVSVQALPDCESLNQALEKSALTLRLLMHSLVGTKWQWPDLSLRYVDS